MKMCDRRCPEGRADARYDTNRLRDLDEALQRQSRAGTATEQVVLGLWGPWPHCEDSSRSLPPHLISIRRQLAPPHSRALTQIVFGLPMELARQHKNLAVHSAGVIAGV